MALTDTADSGVAAHLSQRLNVVTEQQGLHAHTRGCERSFGTAWPPPTTMTSKRLGKSTCHLVCRAYPQRRKKGLIMGQGEKIAAVLTIFCTTGFSLPAKSKKNKDENI
ncbi:hypothetical protein UMZ34_09300 [Halopseudomonas pachastrellae]|nr:hypothetical protein UMZ34_09300 [Halopseudomonas pachastrellae]